MQELGIRDRAKGSPRWFGRTRTRAALPMALVLSILLGNVALGAAPSDRGHAPQVALAGPQNGSFEASLANWSTTGHVEVLQDTDIDSVPPTAVLPTDGGHYALLCNGPGEIDPAELDNLDMDPGPNNDNDRSTLSQTFTLTPSEVPATLSFDWSFLTSEAPTPGSFDDFFRVNLSGPDGGLLVAGSAPTTGVSPYPDVTPIDGVEYTVDSTGPTDGCFFNDGRSAFQKFTTIVDTPGTYILEFLVSDQGNNDHAIDTGLLVDDVQLTPEIDLAVTKSASPDPAIAGESLVYEVNVHNYGSGIARDVVVTDVLPTGVVYVSDTNVPACVESPVGTLTCDLGDLPGGAARTFQIVTSVLGDARAGGALTLSNSVHVEAESPDRDPSNNDFTLRTPLTDEADLKVTKLSVPDRSVEANEIFSYRIFVDNLGPSYARNVTLLDDILASGQFTLMSIVTDPARLGDSCTSAPGVGTAVPGPGTPPPATSTPSPAGAIQCTLGEPLEPQGFGPGNGRWTIEVRVKALNAQDVQNMVRVFSSDPDGAGSDSATADPDMANNSVTHFVAVTAVADLRITKIGRDLADGDFEVVAGGSVRYTITVNNDGPSTAENVTVVDHLPGGLVDGSVEANITVSTGAGGVCTVGNPGDGTDPMVCQVGTLPSGASAVITILADVDPSFVANQPETPFADYLVNDANVFSDTVDPNTLHNRASDAFVHVVGSADLVVAKNAAPTSAAAGTPVSYRVRVTNNGPSTAENPVIDDDLPAGVTFRSATVLGEKGTCVYNEGARWVRCNLDDMRPSEVIEILIVVEVDPDVPGGSVLTNTARRNAGLTVTADPVSGNNVDTATTDVYAHSDVEVAKQSEPTKVYAGEQVKYTVSLRNHGPSDAQDVVVYDLLPDEVVYEVDTNHPVCTMPTNLVGLRAGLSGANVVPPVATQAGGLATFVLNTDTNELHYSLQPTDIVGVTGAALHLGAAGVNGPVHVSLFTGAPPVVSPP